MHSDIVVAAGDRAALERIVRYLLRPALSRKRLFLRDDDVIVCRQQRPDRPRHDAARVSRPPGC
ncbi:MAG: transposase [Deltaproteobacteria bacterium]